MMTKRKENRKKKENLTEMNVEVEEKMRKKKTIDELK